VSNRRKLRSVVTAFALTAAALLLLACGSSSSGSTASTAKSAAGAGRDTVTNGVKTHHPFPGTGSKAINDENPAGAGAGAGDRTTATRNPSQREPTSARAAGHSSNPCKLVTRREAEGIMGRAVNSPALAPLGPSCIYRVRGAKQTVTVAVQATPFASLKSRLKKTQHRTIAGRTAYCGVYGQTTTIVALPRRRVLTIAAPCTMGFGFAAKALPRV
jgi:hypothetical protein